MATFTPLLYDDWWALLDFESIRKSGIAGGPRLRFRLYQKQRLSDTMESSNSERGADPRESRTDFAQKNPPADEPECGSASGDEGKKVDDDSQEAERGNKLGTLELHTSEPRVTQAVTNTNVPRCKTKSAESKSHEVTLTVSIAMALPQGFFEGEEDPVIAEKSNRKKPKQVLPSGVLEAPKAQSYYRIEFNLLPDDPEPMKFDLVMFGVAAKIYTDNETKVLMPWQEGDQVWLAWSHCVKVAVTRDLVLKLASHRVAFRVWDTKDRLSSKARRDRPRTFRLQQGRGGDDADQEGGIKAMVQHLRSVFEMEHPKCRLSVKRRRDSAVLDAARPSELDGGSVKAKASAAEVLASERVRTTAALNRDGRGVPEKGRSAHDRSLGCDGQRDGSGADPKGTVRDKEKELPPTARATQERSAGNQPSKEHKQQSKTDVSPLTSSGVRDQPQVVNQKSASHRNALESAACTEHTHKNGVASVELNPVHLLAGEKSVTDYLVSRTPGIREGLCSITVDKALMSEELRMKLNPLVITVLSATSLPASPVPFHTLKEKCLPVYCQYKLPDMTMHRTKGQEHGSDVYFRDVNVVLTGLLDPDELQQYLGGPPLEIEIHDRDRKLEEPATSPTVFGTEAEDNRLASVSLLSCRRTRFNPFSNSTSRRDPYGIATVDLSELLRGQRRFKATAAIKSSPPPDLSVCRWAEHEERMLGFPGVAYGPLEDPMPMGHYFEANSELKVQVEISHPLKDNIWRLGYPFGRIIYFFRCKSSMALTRLRSEILKINAAAFHLDSATEEMIERALSCYEMSASERNSKEMDVVTGFYLYDNKTHLFVLEGLKDKAIRRLWEKVPIKLSGNEEDQTKILYNSDLSFSTRLYYTLDLSLSPIHLHEALDNIMKQPLLYVREMVPRACFQALSRLSYLFQVKTMKDAVHGELFPSAEMILSMSKEFGIIPLNRQQEEEVDVRCEMQESPLQTIEKLGEPADTSLNDNMELMEDNEEEQHHVETKDFIEGNIEEVHVANLKMEKSKITDTDSLTMEKPKLTDTDSLKIEKPKPAETEAQPPVDNVAPNYSMTQSENSTQQAWELLRKKMAKEYQSTTVASVDADVEQRSLEVTSKAARHTREGFVLPGFRSSMDSNKHPLKPDEARVEELKQPWKENVLHSNILRPTLTRDKWPWSKRFQDFELYKKPSGFFDSEAPVTIHLAGELLQQEQREAAKVQYSRWLRKVLPSEASVGPGPVPEFKCHMVHGESGKLGHLLKDKPMKYSLRTPGLELKPIPALSVVQHCEDGKQHPSVAFSPGPLDHHSLSWEGNRIPRHKADLRQFHLKERGKPRSFLYKRVAPPLSDEERHAVWFQHPEPSAEPAVPSDQSQSARRVTETKTYKGIFMHVL